MSTFGECQYHGYDTLFDCINYKFDLIGRSCYASINSQKKILSLYLVLINLFEKPIKKYYILRYVKET